MDKTSFNSFSHGKLLLFLAVISYFFLMFGNGMLSLTHPDEVFYTQTAKEMIAHKSRLTPVLFDQPQFEKPVFFYWLLILAIKLFGPTPFAARFFPALFGMMGVGITYWMGWMLFGRKRTAFLAGLILASSWIYVALSRAVLTDMVFSIFVIAAIGCFYWAYRFPRPGNAGILLSWMFTALAVLTKGILGFCFPVGVILIYLFAQRDLRFLKNKTVGIGFGLCLFLFLPWHLLMAKEYGHVFLDEYFRNVHIRRIFESEHPKADTWYFYFTLMFAGVMPWSLFCLPAGPLIYRLMRNKTALRSSFLFLSAWIAGILVFVQPAHSKLASYIFPAFPAIALILAFYLNHVLENTESGLRVKSARIYPGILAVLLLAAALAAPYFGRKYLYVIQNMLPVYFFSLVIFGTGAALIFLNFKRKYRALIFAPAGITAMVLVISLAAIPAAEPWVSCQEVSRVLQTVDSSHTPILVSKFYARGVRFYTERPVAVMDVNGEGFFSPHPIPFFDEDGDILYFLRERPVTYAVLKRTDVMDVERVIRSGKFRMETLWEKGGKYIVKVEEL